MVKFFIFFVHRLFNKLIQFMRFGLHGLLMVMRLSGPGFKSFINRKSLLNNNNNNILLL